METEVAPPAENGNESAAEASKKPEESPQGEAPKPPPKTRSRKRSRSRSVDVDKKLQVTLQQCDFEVNGTSAKTEDEQKEKPDEKPEENGDENFKRVTRSQTTTTDEEKKPEESPAAEPPSESPKKRPKKQPPQETEDAESDVIVIMDDPEPELQFDSSDFDSVEGSPLVIRSGVRRSQVGSVKTCIDFDDDKPVERSNDTTIDSQDMTNLSTRAVVGSDVTCATYEDEIQPHDDSYFQQIREKSLSETLRSLSARKPIRSDYHRLAMRSSFGGRAELNTGVKRKARSATPEPEETKRFKSEGSTSLFASLRGRFGRSDAAEGTPTLMGYRDRNNDLHFEEGLENGVADKKNWCNIM